MSPLQDYAQEYLNITMGIPQGYAETESGSGSFCFIGWERYPCRWDFTIRPPVFRCIPFLMWRRTRRNMSSIISACWRAPISQSMRSSAGVTGRGSSLDTYLIQFSATESGGTTMEFVAAFIECQNGFGCYNLIGSYPQGG